MFCWCPEGDESSQDRVWTQRGGLLSCSPVLAAPWVLPWDRGLGVHMDTVHQVCSSTPAFMQARGSGLLEGQGSKFPLPAPYLQAGHPGQDAGQCIFPAVHSFAMSLEEKRRQRKFVMSAVRYLCCWLCVLRLHQREEYLVLKRVTLHAGTGVFAFAYQPVKGKR